MQIKNMSYIIALAEAGTLSGAGKQLGISQPTLSVFLSNLEQELGIDLFLRDKKKLLPTPAGRIYLEAARRILATQELTLQSIRQLTTAPPMEIRIGVTPLRGSEVASKIFARFSARYPNIRLRLQEGYMQELRNMVQNGMASCSLGTCFDTESADFDYITLFREEVIVAIPAGAPPQNHLHGIPTGITRGAVRLSLYSYESGQYHPGHLGLYIPSGRFFSYRGI